MKTTGEAILQRWIKAHVPVASVCALVPAEYTLRRTNVGTFKTMWGGMVRIGHIGQFDFNGELSNGKRLEVELKSKGESLSPAQVAYQKHLWRMGVPNFVSYTKEDFLEQIDLILRAEGIRT